ncbi:MAG: zinc-binding dehydrogenase [bacterium]
MRAAVITKFGAPDVLKILEWPVPIIGANDVLVRVHAIGLNFADVMARLGIYPSIPKPPFIPGIEFTGVVEKAGAEVTTLKPGDRVAGFSKQGAYAEYVSISSHLAYRIPDTMSYKEAAALTVTALTAYHALVTLGHLQKGEKLLLHAAAGGVGTIALQIAQFLGAEIYATAGSKEKLELAKSLGAHHLINYREEDFEAWIRHHTGGYGIDVVLDSIGGRTTRKGWNLIAPMGRYIIYGFASVTGERTIRKLGAVIEFLSSPILFPPAMTSKNAGMFGFNLYFLSHKVDYLSRALKEILDWYSLGVIKPIIGSTYRFEDIMHAQAALQARKTVGKVVVTFPS